MKILVGTVAGLHEIDGPIVLPDTDVTALTVYGSTWWLLAGGQEVLRREVGEFTTAATLEAPLGTCLLAGPDGLLIGTAEAHLLRLSSGVLESVASFAQAEGRDDWYTPWGGPPDTRSLSADAAGTWFVNVHVGGILRSHGGGAAWEPTIDIDADVHQVLAHPREPGRVFAATAFGLAESADSGETWTFGTDGLHSTYSRAVALCHDSLLVTASEGHLGRRSAVYRRRASGGTFEKCEAGLPEWFESNVDTHCLATSGSTAVFGTADGDVFVSTDEGITWETVGKGLPRVGCVAIAGG